jgi:predicted deacetylase
VSPRAPQSMPGARQRSRRVGNPRTIAVALHGIEPATFERCAVIRDWLADHGVDRVTLLVIPARDLHPIGERCPAMIDWLIECRRAGDAIAQHGFQLVRPGAESSSGALLGRHGHSQRRGEFVGLDDEETRRAVHAGWRLLKLAGIEPDGFVAPAYGYTPALRSTLAARFQWWAGLFRIHGLPSVIGASDVGRRSGERSHSRAGADQPVRGRLAPAWSMAGAGPLSRALAPALLRGGALLPMSTLRVDLHPSDLHDARHMMALEWVLARSAPRRAAITYGELAGVGRGEKRPDAQPLALVNIAGSNGLTADRPA